MAFYRMCEIVRVRKYILKRFLSSKDIDFEAPYRLLIEPTFLYHFSLKSTSNTNFLPFLQSYNFATYTHTHRYGAYKVTYYE